MNEILQKAYDALEERGWCQGGLTQPDGKLCLEGAFIAAANGDVHPSDVAILVAADDRPDVNAAWRKLTQAVKEETGAAYYGVWAWNDAAGRSVEDVKLVLRKAIEDDE